MWFLTMAFGRSVSARIQHSVDNNFWPLELSKNINDFALNMSKALDKAYPSQQDPFAVSFQIDFRRTRGQKA